MSDVLYAKNSQFIQVSGLKDQSTTPATYVNSATLVATLFDPSGTAVTGAQNMTGAYQPSSNGVYRFAVDPALFSPAVGSGYVLQIDGTGTGGSKYECRRSVKIKLRNTGLEP